MNAREVRLKGNLGSKKKFGSALANPGKFLGDDPANTIRKVHKNNTERSSRKDGEITGTTTSVIEQSQREMFERR